MGETKVCTKCKEELPATTEYFHRHNGKIDGLKNECKKCVKAYHKTYYVENKKHINERNINWWNSNKETGKTLSDKWYKANKERKLKKGNEWRNNNKGRVNESARKHMNEKYKSNLTFRISSNIASSVWRSLKGNKKGKRWEMLVGYSIDQLKKHLENKFKLGMSWENYGKWHIDHKRPVASFNFKTSEDKEFKECWSLDNLQPLWAEDNLRKNSLWNGIKHCNVR